MNTDPLTISQDAPIEMLSKVFAEHHRVNPIPVIDDAKHLVGIVSRFDLVRFFADETTGKIVEVDHDQISDQKVENFVNNFEKRFVLVSKTRTRFWLLISLSFALVGFIVAFAIILRIATK